MNERMNETEVRKRFKMDLHHGSQPIDNKTVTGTKPWKKAMEINRFECSLQELCDRMSAV